MEGRDGVALTKKQYESNKRFNDKTYEQLGFRSRKDERLDELIAMGAKKTGQTKSMYMKSAIQAQLARDGITIDMLPHDTKYIPPEPEPKQPKRYMIYMITERYINDRMTDNKYIACFPTLKAAEKYAMNKLDKKIYPADWTYTIWGRYIEADKQVDAWNTLKDLIRKEVEEDKRTGLDGSTPNYLDRINEVYPAEYTDDIVAEEGAPSQYYFEELDIDIDELNRELFGNEVETDSTEENGNEQG